MMKFFFKRRKPWTPKDGVTNETKFAEIGPFLEYFKEDTREELKRAAQVRYGDPAGMTVGEFIAISHGDFSLIDLFDKNDPDMTALQYFWLESFKDMAEQMKKALDVLKPPQPDGAAQFSQACRPMNMEESMLLFCREYFQLHSFNEARDIYLSDFLLAKKDRYNVAVFEKSRSDHYKLKHQNTKK